MRVTIIQLLHLGCHREFHLFYLYDFPPVYTWHSGTIAYLLYTMLLMSPEIYLSRRNASSDSTPCYSLLLNKVTKTFELKPLGFLFNILKKLLNYSSLGNILPHHARIFKANSRVLAYNHGLTLYPEHIGLRTRHWVFGESATFFIMLFSSPSLMWDGLGWYILNPRRSSGLCKLSINRKSNSILNMLSAYYGGLEQSLYTLAVVIPTSQCTTYG